MMHLVGADMAGSFIIFTRVVFGLVGFSLDVSRGDSRGMVLVVRKRKSYVLGRLYSTWGF